MLYLMTILSRILAIVLMGLVVLGVSLNANAKTKGEIILQSGLDALDQDQKQSVMNIYNQLASYPVERQVLGWAIAVYGDQINYNFLVNVASRLNGWPEQKRIQHNIEKAILESQNNRLIQKTFANKAPSGFYAALELAKYYLRNKRIDKARETILPFWKYEKLDKNQERAVARELRSILKTEDYVARVELLLSKKLLTRARSFASSANMEPLVTARIAVERNLKSAGAHLQSLNKTHARHPNFFFSMARFFRRNDQNDKAAQTLIGSSPPHENSADLFRQEQRIVASDLIEEGGQKNFQIAYTIMSRNVARSPAARIDSEFYAGWIALRYLNNPTIAQKHFQQITTIAKTPLSLSRGYYWLARAYELANSHQNAQIYFQKAAQYDSSYYGQLALIALGQRGINVLVPAVTQRQQQEFENQTLIQALNKLEIAEHHRKAKVFYRYLAKNLTNVGELAMLAQKAQKKGNYRLALEVGKIAHRNGRNVNSLAWPVGVIPDHKSPRLTSLAYAVSRQESTFQINARSSANALGLMQLLPSTAKASARKAGLAYSSSRLVRDPAYNTRLGTEYLESQIKKFGGSYVLAFAAYNAGPNTVNKWIKRFGDPRGESLYNVIDWIEKIPYSETRNYVQRVVENYQIYKARLSESNLDIDKILTKGSI